MHKVSCCSDLASLLETRKPVRNLSFHDNSSDEDMACRRNSFHLDASQERERKEGRKVGRNIRQTQYGVCREKARSVLDRSVCNMLRFCRPPTLSLTPSRVPFSHSFMIPLSLHPSGPL